MRTVQDVYAKIDTEELKALLKELEAEGADRIRIMKVQGEFDRRYTKVNKYHELEFAHYD